MAIPGLEAEANLTVGSKQTKLAIENGQAIKVFVARDAEARLVDPIVQQCTEKGIPVVRAVSMSELGKACGIQVGAAVAAIVQK